MRSKKNQLTADFILGSITLQIMGGKVFFKSSGRKTSYRFNKLLEIAKLKKGCKVLDIGRGRGTARR